MRNLFLAVYYWVNVMTWVKLLVLVAVKGDIKGIEHIPRKGALILASNHLNVGDPSVLTGITPRRIHSRTVDGFTFSRAASSSAVSKKSVMLESSQRRARDAAAGAPADRRW